MQKVLPFFCTHGNLPGTCHWTICLEKKEEQEIWGGKERPFGIKEEIWIDRFSIFPSGSRKGWCCDYFQLLIVTASPGDTGFWHRQNCQFSSLVRNPSLKVSCLAWKINYFAPLVEHCHSSNWVREGESCVASRACPFMLSLPCSFCQLVQIWQIGYSVPITPYSSVWADHIKPQCSVSTLH